MRPLLLFLTIAAPTAAPVQTSDSALLAADQWIRARVEADSFSGAVLVAKNGVPLLRQAYGISDRERHRPVTPAPCRRGLTPEEGLDRLLVHMY